MVCWRSAALPAIVGPKLSPGVAVAGEDQEPGADIPVLPAGQGAPDRRVLPRRRPEG